MVFLHGEKTIFSVTRCVVAVLCENETPFFPCSCWVEAGFRNGNFGAKKQTFELLRNVNISHSHA